MVSNSISHTALSCNISQRGSEIHIESEIGEIITASSDNGIVGDIGWVLTLCCLRISLTCGHQEKDCKYKHGLTPRNVLNATVDDRKMNYGCDPMNTQYASCIPHTVCITCLFFLSPWTDLHGSLRFFKNILQKLCSGFFRRWTIPVCRLYPPIGPQQLFLVRCNAVKI